MYSTLHFAISAIGGFVCIVMALVYAAISARKAGITFYVLMVAGLALGGMGLWILAVRDLLFAAHAVNLARTTYCVGVITTSVAASVLALALIEHVTAVRLKPERRKSRLVRIAAIVSAIILLLLVACIALVNILLYS